MKRGSDGWWGIGVTLSWARHTMWQKFFQSCASNVMTHYNFMRNFVLIQYLMTEWNSSFFSLTIQKTIVSFIPLFVLVFSHFWQWIYKNTKTLHNLCLHFGQDGKKEKITQLKGLKYQKTKDKNMKILRILCLHF